MLVYAASRGPRKSLFNVPTMLRKSDGGTRPPRDLELGDMGSHHIHCLSLPKYPETVVVDTSSWCELYVP